MVTREKLEIMSLVASLGEPKGVLEMAKYLGVEKVLPERVLYQLQDPRAGEEIKRYAQLETYRICDEMKMKMYRREKARETLERVGIDYL
jgi:hypothetical protein